MFTNAHTHTYMYLYTYGVMFIVGSGHGDLGSSLVGLFSFHTSLIPLKKLLIQSFFRQVWVNSQTEWAL